MPKLMICQHGTTCNRCGKFAPGGLIAYHACHPYKKYNRSKRVWVDKTPEEYSKVEKARLDCQICFPDKNEEDISTCPLHPYQMMTQEEYEMVAEKEKNNG